MFKSLLVSAAIAASTFMAPAAHAGITTCWWPSETRQGVLEAELCQISSRTNANGHKVYDLVDHLGNKGVLVFWNDDTVEFIFNGYVYDGIHYEDEQGDVRIEIFRGGNFAIAGDGFRF